MKHILCCVLLSIGIIKPVLACNTCGSSSGGQSMGLLPSMRSHFVGVQYQQRVFNSIHPAFSETKPAEQSTEYYRQAQLWGRYQLSKRLQLFAFVPYHINTQYKNGVATQNAGIGDVSVLANVVIIGGNKTSKKFQSTLLAGGGIKAPTGFYSVVPVIDRNGIPNMQPGTGSWDMVVNTNYTLQTTNWGCNAEASYTFTTTSADSYKYGNKLSTGALCFYKLTAGKLAILPQAGIRYEYALHDYDNYERKWLNEQTGGYQLFGNVGMQAFYKRTGLQLNYMLPVAQNYADGNVKSAYTASAGLFLLL